MTTPTENWPKTAILEYHEQAVAHGFIWVEGISEADAESLRSRCYRVRRRSDKSMAAFIPPEYHLVMIGRWEPGPDGRGRLPFIYNRLPSGQPLPTIRPATEAEAAAYVPAPSVRSAPPISPKPIHFEPDDLAMKPAEINNFVESMQAKAKERRS